MIADAMLDTNVLVYAISRDPDEEQKQRAAMKLVKSRQIGLSGQVLQEFYSITTRKIKKPITGLEALGWLQQFENLPCVPIDATIVREGAGLSMRFKISYWDGAILAAAHRLQAKILYTEDLNHGQAYGSVTVMNPFRDA